MSDSAGMSDHRSYVNLDGTHNLPNFNQVGWTNMYNSEGNEISTTSEYFSVENEESCDSENRLELRKKCHPESVNKSSPPPSSKSSDDNIRAKRESLRQSRNIYTSFEDTENGPKLTHNDSVFSENVSPPPQRRVSRERLTKQRSKSASDMPDYTEFQRDIAHAKFLGKENFSSQVKRVANLSSSQCFQLKQEIEGTVHDGTKLERSVSFKEDVETAVYNIPHWDRRDSNEGKECKTPVSPHGGAGRQYYRDLKSSGYGTGSSSKNSLQSQLSSQTNLSDSVLTDNSFDNKDSASRENSFSDNEDGQTPENIPYLSIFSSVVNGQSSLQSSGSLKVDGLEDPPSERPLDPQNVPYLSIFQQTEDGSLMLLSQDFTSDVDIQGTENMPVSNTSPVEQSPNEHDVYAVKILEEELKKNESCGNGVAKVKVSVEKQGIHESASVMIEKVTRSEPSREILNNFLTKCDSAADPQDLWKFWEKFVYSDSSTPSPSPRLIPGRHQANVADNHNQEQFTLPAIDEEKDMLYGEQKSPRNPPLIDRVEHLKEQLERAYRCQEFRCQDLQCRKAKDAVHSFEMSVQVFASLDVEQENLLLALRCHSERCIFFKCPVPYCHLLLDIDPWSKTEAVQRIHQQLDVIVEVTDTAAPPKKFLPLNPSLQHRTALQEGEDWIGLSPLSKSRNVILISDMSSAVINPCTYVLKKMPLLEDDHQWSVYGKLQNLNHPNIVEHLWAMEQGAHFLICTRFMKAGSLRQLMQDCDAGLSWMTVVKYMKQVITGVLELHKQGIAYMNWTSCNILLDDAHQRALVSNLSVSVDLHSGTVDFGGIKDMTPPSILPPEVLKERPDIWPVSDSWGCGCLLYELCVGHRVWYHYRHESRDFLWKQLKGKVPPLPQELKKWPQVFQACWQHCVQKRKSLSCIRDLLDRSESPQAYAYS